MSAITVTNISQEFLPTRWHQNSTGINVEQNYITVTLCLRLVCASPLERERKWVEKSGRKGEGAGEEREMKGT